MKPEMQNKLSTQIRQALIKRGLTMRILAGHIGISSGHLSKVLSNSAVMSDDKWIKACEFMGWGYDPDAQCAIIPPRSSAAPQAPQGSSAAAENIPHPDTAPQNTTTTEKKEDHPMETTTRTNTVTLTTEEAAQCLRCVEHAIRYSMSTHDENCTFENMQAAFQLHSLLLKGVDEK